MKTLDEVIKAMNWCTELDQSGCGACPYADDADNRCYAADALYYLKEYQSVKAVLDFKKRQYEETIEKVMRQGQEREACCQAEIARYQEAVKNCEAAENKYRQLSEELRKTSEELSNDPLTWDELKQIEGKPVWVEFFYEDGQQFDSDWFLVDFVSESFCDVIGKLGTSRLAKNDYWQAYRKERT